MLSSQTISTVKSTVPLLMDKGPEITAVFYNRLFTNNPDLKHIFNMANQRNSSQATALADAVIAYANHIDQIDVLVPAVKRIASKHTSIGIMPEHYPIVGENLLAAIQDVLELPDDHAALKAWGEAYGALARIFINTEETMYADSENQPGGWRGFRSFIIDRIVEETEEVKSFYFKASDGKKILSYSGGQYIGIKLPAPDGSYDEIRQYSLSSWGDSEYYRISVKAEHEGVASRHLHKRKVGDEVFISAPRGQFLLNKASKNHIFISGGVGITPLYSMLLEALNSGANDNKIQFIACSKSANHQIFENELTALSKKSNIDLKRAFEFGDGADWSGYLTETILNRWITDKSASVYICGPLPFMSAIKSMLNKMGIVDDQLHYEVFGPTEAIK